MTSFEDALAHHRSLLAKNMAEWSQQQELLFAKYTGGECLTECQHLSGPHALKRSASLDEFTEIPLEATGCLQSTRCTAKAASAKLNQESLRSPTENFQITPYEHAAEAALDLFLIEHNVIAPRPDSEAVDPENTKIHFQSRLPWGEHAEIAATNEQTSEDLREANIRHSSVSSLLSPATAIGISETPSEDAFATDVNPYSSAPFTFPTSGAASRKQQCSELSPAKARLSAETVSSPVSSPPSSLAPATPIQRRTWGSRATIFSHAPLTMDGIKAQLSVKEWLKPRTKKRIHHGSIAKVVESYLFSGVFAFIIMANAALMAIAADHMLEAVKTGTTPDESAYSLADAVFTTCYVIELGLKFAAYGLHFFVGPEWKSNWFDFIVVLTAILDLLAPFFMGGTLNMSYLRVNRMVKLIKMIRVVKVYLMFKELRLIVASILGCAKIMFWAITLITVVLFMFSLFFVQGVTEHLRTHPVSEVSADFMLFWGSTSTAMISLFKSPTGGENWSEVAEPLWELGWGYYCAFMIYICFFMFFVVNVLTGLFVDAALHASVKDDASMIHAEMKNKKEYVSQIQSLFHRLDDSGSGELTWKEFEKRMNSPDMLTFASALDIEIADLDEFFKMISAGGSEVVDIETFVVGCMKLKGAAKSLDVVSLLYRYKALERQIKNFIDRTDERLAEQPRPVGRVHRKQSTRYVSKMNVKRSVKG